MKYKYNCKNCNCATELNKKPVVYIDKKVVERNKGNEKKYKEETRKNKKEEKQWEANKKTCEKLVEELKKVYEKRDTRSLVDKVFGIKKDDFDAYLYNEHEDIWEEKYEYKLKPLYRFQTFWYPISCLERYTICPICKEKQYLLKNTGEVDR